AQAGGDLRVGELLHPPLGLDEGLLPDGRGLGGRAGGVRGAGGAPIVDRGLGGRAGGVRGAGGAPLVDRGRGGGGPLVGKLHGENVTCPPRGPGTISTPAPVSLAQAASASGSW